MDIRADVQKRDAKVNLGLHASNYIRAAQKCLDSGNSHNCVRFLLCGIEAGAEPKHLLKTAHTNALNGAKKLLANPSAKKAANPRGNSVTSDRKPSKSGNTGQQSSNTIHLEPSRLSTSLKRFKNLGAPIRPIRRTPKTSTAQKISLKKLEESPMSMRYLDALSPLPPCHLANQVKLDQWPFADRPAERQLSPTMDAKVIAENNQSSFDASSLPGEILKGRESSPLINMESFHRGLSNEKRNLFCDKENQNVAFASMTEPGAHVKRGNIFEMYGSRSSSKTTQPCSSHKKFLDESPDEGKQLPCENRTCDSAGLEGPFGVSSCENEISTRMTSRKGKDSLDSTDTFSTHGSLSDCWSGTFSTDQNFLPARSNSDSGYIEVLGSCFAQMNKASSACKKEIVDEESAKSQTQRCELQCDGGVVDADCRPSSAAVCNLEYIDNTPSSEKHAFKSDELMARSEHESTGQNVISEKVGQFSSAVKDIIPEGTQSSSNLMPDLGIDKSFGEMMITGVPCEKLNLSGVAELSNLALSDDQHIPATSSGTLLSTSSTDTLSAASKSTSSLTVKSSLPQDAITLETPGVSGQPFKIPTAPAPKIHQPDDVKGFVRNFPEVHQADLFNSSQRSLGISDYLVKMRQDAEASRAKSQSTTKKHKMLRIKKERYKVLSILGKGGSSKVYEVENDDGKVFAVKCVPLEDLDDVVFYSHCNEIDMLWGLRNDQYIIKLYEYELKNEKLFMVMEKGEMDLEKYLYLNRQMESENIRNLWTQMLYAVNSIHKQGIIHTDLKPANFLFVGSTLKLIDFGIAKGLKENCTSTQRECLIGTLNYMAPESVSESIKRTDYGSSRKNYEIRRATDIWSLGCILYLMVYGKTPFQHIQPKALKFAAITDGSQIAFPDIENNDLLDTIKGCLKRNPSQRYTIEELLAHPFVSKGASQLAKESEDGDALMENRQFLQHVTESAIHSPNSLDRAQKVLARRKLMEDSGADQVGKPVY